MKKDDVILKSKKYSSNKEEQMAYIAGFQSACNEIRQYFETDYNDTFVDKMEVLGNISYVEFDEILEENQDVLERVKNNSVIHWHDLRKNHNDLPENNRRVLVCDSRRIVRYAVYNNNGRYFFDTYGSVDFPIAWMYEPEFNE